ESSDCIHSGKLDVHENEGRRFVQGELKPIFSGLALDGLVALNLEHVARELSVLLVVFDDEDQFTSHLILQMLRSFCFTLARLSFVLFWSGIRGPELGDSTPYSHP